MVATGDTSNNWKSVITEHGSSGWNLLVSVVFTPPPGLPEAGGRLSVLLVSLDKGANIYMGTITKNKHAHHFEHVTWMRSKMYLDVPHTLHNRGGVFCWGHLKATHLATCFGQAALFVSPPPETLQASPDSRLKS